MLFNRKAPFGATCGLHIMSDTYRQIYLHVVFAVSGRVCVINAARREELQKYVSEILIRKVPKI
jgi:hypothetical protein